ncbi:MAG TPA: hypothetical protein VFU01_11685 [Gemmatimonadaceae bacterium]|nr:hypothetical protein [Gemmatimonadaceae bacterium]
MTKKKTGPGNAKGRAPRKRNSESGQPGGGKGRIDAVGKSGVYPMSAGLPPGKHPEIRSMASWGQGDRGAAGYEDSGGSELVMREGQLLGGLTAGPSGEPTIDIHAKPPAPPRTQPQLPRREKPRTTHGKEK